MTRLSRATVISAISQLREKSFIETPAQSQYQVKNERSDRSELTAELRRWMAADPPESLLALLLKHWRPSWLTALYRSLYAKHAGRKTGPHSWGWFFAVAKNAEDEQNAKTAPTRKASGRSGCVESVGDRLRSTADVLALFAVEEEHAHPTGLPRSVSAGRAIT